MSSPAAEPAGTADIQREMARAALEGDDEAALFGRLCDWLVDAGVPLARASMATILLDPTLDSRGLRWQRGAKVESDTFRRERIGQRNEVWAQSPFRALLESGELVMRRRLDGGHVRGEFPVLDDLQVRGLTDYLAVLTGRRVGGRPDRNRGIATSWATEAAEGFDDMHLAAIHAVLPCFAVVCLLETARRMSHTLVATYLGHDAATRVLAGNIVRGQAEKIRAVVWFSDLAGYTHLSETSSPEAVLALLNDYAEAQVEAIEQHGGHVLKFIGDAVLAIFPHEDDREACARALAAALAYRERLESLRAQRIAEGLPAPETHLALHVGDLLYGNVGSSRRLDFTVLGPAVNEAARIEALCGSLEKPVIASAAFAAAAGGARSRLVSLGRYALKGVTRPQEMFTLDVDDGVPGRVV